jgi:hypothetical protein
VNGPWPVIPGVSAAGHVGRGGAWHPNAADNCDRCLPPRPARPARHRSGQARGPGREVTAEVTAADIRNGTPGSVTESHPVALAVARALNLPPRHPGVFLRVGQDWFSLQAGTFYESHDLPAPRGWIRAYDDRRAVRPFTFTFTTTWGAGQ